MRTNPGYLVIICSARAALGSVGFAVATPRAGTAWRGVLRLMASVIHTLWEKGDRSPLILPSMIPIDDPRVQSELTRYLSDRLHEEVAYLSYYFHWPYQQVMQLDHRERQRWVGEVAGINQRLNEERGAKR